MLERKAESMQEELERRLEAVMISNLREEMELAALYESAFGAEFRELRQLREELMISEAVRRVNSEETTLAKIAREIGVNRATLHRWVPGKKSARSKKGTDYVVRYWKSSKRQRQGR